MALLNESGEVRAAGGAVVREGAGGLEILLVHRPQYDDWTLPKGKAEDGETDEECALREVAEETGLVCTIEHELPTVRYHDPLRRPKAARYWRMTPRTGHFTPHAEVDAIRWVPVAEAPEVLTYAHDADVVRALEAT